jgi:peptidoglycan/LPS O-acetylase OafA/YrhL
VSASGDVAAAVPVAATPAAADAPRAPRAGNLDILRALAAGGVLVVHAYALGGRAVPLKAQHWYDLPLIALTPGIWLFFGISGYLISRPFVDSVLTGRPLPNPVGYALRRGLRIFPLYWIAVTAVIAIAGSAGATRWELVVHYLLLNNLVPGREEAMFGVAWTLTLEVVFYIAVPLFAAAAQRWLRPRSAERLAAFVLASWIASIGVAVIGDLSGDGTIGLWLRGSAPAMWQMFCPGVMLAIAPHLGDARWRRWVVELPARREALPAALVLVGGATLLGAIAPLRFGIVPYQLIVDATRPLFAVGFAVVIAGAIRAGPWGKPSGWLVQLGLMSYGIYLLHAVVAEYLYRHPNLIPLHDTGVPAFALHVALLAAVTVPLALVSWRGLEQPAIALSRRLSRRLGPAPRHQRITAGR